MLIELTFQLENCARPAIITKDLSMIIYGRDARTGPRSLKHLFSGNYRNPEANRLSGVYELSLRRASEAGSPGRNVDSFWPKALPPKLSLSLANPLDCAAYSNSKFPHLSLLGALVDCRIDRLR